jgi:ATP-binding cassette subfamily C protein
MASHLRSLVALTRRYVIVLALLSAIVNLLALNGSIYMLQVYDRVLSSQSIPTLVGISLLCLAAYVFQGLLEVTRGQILVAVAAKVDLGLSRRAQQAAMMLPLLKGPNAAMSQPVREVDTIRSFLGGPGPTAFLDLPWTPVFLIFLFLLHPVLGLVTIAGMIVMTGLAVVTDRLVDQASRSATKASMERAAAGMAMERNAEVIHAMGFAGRMLDRFEGVNRAHLLEHHKMSDGLNMLTVIARTFRIVLQSALLGLSAYLVIQGKMSAGGIIAASIVAGRALAPIDSIISHWKAFTAAQQAAASLQKTLAEVIDPTSPLELPPPKQTLRLEGVSVTAPGGNRLVLADLNFELRAGTVTAVLGPSASGKSSLARAIVGCWPAVRGVVSLDGAGLARWDRQKLGQHVGYLPQDIELLDGTVAENIARFEPNAPAEKILAAAKNAGVHELILSLPKGYETRIGRQGSEALSGGQRQRIGLARALYGDPFLVVLDEPNSNLDNEGDAALLAALRGVRERGGIALVVSHRMNLLSEADIIMVLKDGRIVKAGPRDEMMPAQPKQAAGSLGLVPAREGKVAAAG